MTSKIAAALIGACLVSPVSAQDVFVQNPFDGLYAGVYTDQSFANTQTKFDAGVLAGVRFSPLDDIVLGIEAQAGATLNANSFHHAYFMGTAGVVLAGNTLVFGSFGGGIETWAGTSNPTIKGGIGVEFAANDILHLRGEAYAANDALNSNVFYGLRASAIFQFN